MESNEVDTTFINTSGNGIRMPIVINIDPKVPYVEIGVRNFLIALHLKLPSIPVRLITMTNNESSLNMWKNVTQEYKEDMRNMINELCSPYLILNTSNES
jgi:hypothetical protein